MQSYQSILLVPPTYFDIIDVKNPHMKENQGTLDKDKAKLQWLLWFNALQKTGKPIHLLDPLPGAEDMVFCANPSFLYKKICVPSRMRYPSRQKEVKAHVDWFKKNGFEIKDCIPSNMFFEGHGDAIWHPGKFLLWGGVGPRSEKRAYEILQKELQIPIINLNLVSDEFYHLDTCFCPIDEKTLLYFPEAFDTHGKNLIESHFSQRLEVTKEEALKMACNAVVWEKDFFIEKGMSRICVQMKTWGYSVNELDTSEFRKSGGSLFCMKQFIP
jgi:N-dimethylarginine dimethylaminohydrolase